MSKRKTIKCLVSELGRSQKKIRELQELNLRLLQDAATALPKRRQTAHSHLRRQPRRKLLVRKQQRTMIP